MRLHTFTARSLAEALRIVRDELGPDASLLHTREVGSQLARWLGASRIEVTASIEVEVPSRLPSPLVQQLSPAPGHVPAVELQDFRLKFRNDLQTLSVHEASLVEQMSQNKKSRRS